MLGVAWQAARKKDLSSYQLFFLLLGLAGVFVIGARISYILIYWHLYLNGTLNPLAPSIHGFTLYGGLIFVGIYLYTAARICSIEPWQWVDINTIGLLSYVILGKLGCFINGCCFGTPTVMPWGVPYKEGSQAYIYFIEHFAERIKDDSFIIYSDRIHPVQLYESAVGLMLILLLIFMLKKRLPSGTAFLTVSCLYSLCRLLLWHFRVIPEQALPYIPAIYLFIIIIAAVFLLKRISACYKHNSVNTKEESVWK